MRRRGDHARLVVLLTLRVHKRALQLVILHERARLGLIKRVGLRGCLRGRARMKHHGWHEVGAGLRREIPRSSYNEHQ